MTLIHLHGPALDKRGHYRDAGTDLLVGSAGDDDVTEEAAAELVADLRAVEPAEAE
ncbi:hypothetical protein [Sphingomonas solaris]|uniref:hypothetical protein n=1 Tax=Alterirhizorhabdus solaris TaxID=2529389 RepID=UPI001396BFEF|nr:hypothetical protein [Sphingomonas solaris]